MPWLEAFHLYIGSGETEWGPVGLLGMEAFLSPASLVAQTVKRLHVMRETQVQSLGQEDPLEKEMATRSSILAWEIPWTEETGGLQSMGSQKSQT